MSLNDSVDRQGASFAETIEQVAIASLFPFFTYCVESALHYGQRLSSSNYAPAAPELLDDDAQRTLPRVTASRMRVNCSEKARSAWFDFMSA